MFRHPTTPSARVNGQMLSVEAIARAIRPIARQAVAEIRHDADASGPDALEQQNAADLAPIVFRSTVRGWAARGFPRPLATPILLSVKKRH